MNKIAKRIIAGVSAAAMFVSAVSLGVFTNSFTETSYADSGSEGKNGKSTGFSNLEQDTDKDNNYNTGYGLHTNKTATEAGADGRTFDVNLESWYVGENPVDVATVLDASGSMAWTVDTLDPLEINDKEISDILGYDDYNGDGNCDIKDVIAYQNQDENGGYLPQDVVDKILNPKNTDNSKLSYAGYKYYIYEARSSVSEFVPLGYWDGGKTIDNLNPIGYYPFENSLENKAKSGGEGKYIEHAEKRGTSLSDAQTLKTSYKPSFSGGYLDLSETDKHGNLVIDLKQLNLSEEINISFTLICENVNKACAPQEPILYLGDGSNKNYIALMRGRSHDEGSGASKHLYVFDSTGKAIIPFSPKLDKADNNAFNDKTLDQPQKCTLQITQDTNIDDYIIVLTVGTNSFSYRANAALDQGKLYLIIGGNEALPQGSYTNKDKVVITPEDLKGIKIKDLKITGTSTEAEDFSKSITLDSEASLNDAGVIYSAQGEIGAESISTTAQTEQNAEAIYSDSKYNGNHALNLSQTAKLGAVLLDAKPENDSEFTLSFAVKKAKEDEHPVVGPNILYIGNDGADRYYRIYRGEGSNSNRLRMRKKDNTSNNVNINSVFADKTDYSYITVVVNGTKVTQYLNGVPYTTDSNSLLSETLNDYIADKNLSLLLGGLWDDTYTGSDILIDDLYVFDQALSEEEVKIVYNDRAAGNTTVDAESCGKYHAVTMDDKAIAQISEELMGNKKIDERRGWYYVNSHSNWTDISGCLESGKQYIAIAKDPSLGEIPKDATGFDSHTGYKINSDGLIADEIKKDSQSFATIPSIWITGHYLIKNKGTLSKEEEETLKEMGEEKAQQYYDFYEKLIAGNDAEKEYESPDEERSIRFYVDSQGYLRCFYCTGDTSWKADSTTEQWNYNPRTFCSAVYVKKTDASDEQITKYEQLNIALNQFYENLAEHSDLTNSAIVRFSTNNVVDKDSSAKTSENLKMLIMKDWTNWSDEYIRDETLTKNKYLENLLIPDEGETSTKTNKSTSREDFFEYPYVMTGGTYTWTGLKAFYDNMVDTKTGSLTSGNKVYDIANDARDKYLIIFTDGRDNTVDQTNKSSSSHTNNIGYAPEGTKAETNSELAKLWADKLKEEGYTIYCVMMATGSISPTANKDEYDKAHDFLTTLAGSTEADKELADLKQQLKNAEEEAADPKIIDELKERIAEFEKYVIVADPSSKGNTTVDAFQEILTQIQQPRKDYTVQDYIDPRFDLIDKSGEIYHLGAGGKITKSDGAEVKTVGNVIKELDENPGKEESYYKSLGLAYTPQDSYMVNRSEESGGGYTTGDGVGTGYLYYDDEKDMYYLRWTDQIIPMENKAFDTKTDPSNKKLDVWSATIRLKAKDDFIGGNDILTNGNEAGENLVFSEATIQNMDKGENYKLYGFEEGDLDTTSKKIPYCKKLAALSGTNRKINAVDAGGVSQAVYGNGIDIPSSGFPRVVVDVRLKPLDAKNLNDVVYMGEVISPTMMLADLENGYMTGSYYLEYLERYAYRIYGYDAAKTPLLDLLNQWLKINKEDEEKKTFTIPYMYLPGPSYNGDRLEVDGDNKVKVKNSTGMSTKTFESGSDEYIIADFTDLNLRDVTGFITYTWKRDDDGEEQQKTTDTAGNTIHDITKEYVVKNTKQIKYNLQLKFTPLKDSGLKDFELDQNFITPDAAGEGGEKFFDIVKDEFNDKGVDKWSIDYNRTNYLKAMVHEEQTYEPHVMYDTSQEKWVLVDDSKTGFASEDAVKAYTEADETEQTIAKGDNEVIDSGVYDWDSGYKKTAGEEQIEKKNIKGYYTETTENVQLVDDKGNPVTDETGNLIAGSGDAYSLEANTTYVKDAVNGALALELVVDGKYLGDDSPIKTKGVTDGYTFTATRYYSDPNDPLPYGDNKEIKANTGTDGKKYQLTFKVNADSIPVEPKDGEIYTVWAELSEVKVENGAGGYTDITEEATEANPYLGYKDSDAKSLPIGTYVISTTENDLDAEQFKIGTTAGEDVKFEYLKLDNIPASYTYGRFPENVYNVSKSAADDTKDGEYLINNDGTDYAPKNIADCNRTKATDKQELTFYFGTVAERTISGETLNNAKGYDRNDKVNSGKDYAKDRLGIIMLSNNNNELEISKKVTNTNVDDNKNHFWQFNITFKPDDSVDNMDEFNGKNDTGDGFSLTWYRLDTSGNWEVNKDTATDGLHYPETIKFSGPDSEGAYTATLSVKHNEKVRINGLPEGTWQVTEEESSDLFYSPHNNANGLGEGEWEYERSNATSPDILLNPNSHVDFVNEFPYSLPSAGGMGIDRFIFLGTMATVTVGLTVIASYYRRRNRRRIN